MRDDDPHVTREVFDVEPRADERIFREEWVVVDPAVDRPVFEKACREDDGFIYIDIPDADHLEATFVESIVDFDRRFGSTPPDAYCSVCNAAIYGPIPLAEATNVHGMRFYCAACVKDRRKVSGRPDDIEGEATEIYPDRPALPAPKEEA